MDDRDLARSEPHRSRSPGPVVAAAVWAVGAAAAFAALDWLLAAFLVTLGLTVVVVVFLSSDWVRSSTFEEREAERARRRKAQWDAGAAARERDRVRWAAHQARRSGRPDGVDG